MLDMQENKETLDVEELITPLLLDIEELLLIEKDNQDILKRNSEDTIISSEDSLLTEADYWTKSEDSDMSGDLEEEEDKENLVNQQEKLENQKENQENQKENQPENQKENQEEKPKKEVENTKKEEFLLDLMPLVNMSLSIPNVITEEEELSLLEEPTVWNLNQNLFAYQEVKKLPYGACAHSKVNPLSWLNLTPVLKKVVHSNWLELKELWN